MSQGFYEMLGVEADAPPEKIRAAYQRRLAELVRRLRAARKQGADVSILEAQERELREAIDVLGDQARRRRYDAFRRAVEGELPTDAEGLWDQARWSLVDPIAPLAVAVLRALTDLPVGDPLPDPTLKAVRAPAPRPVAAPVVPLPAPRAPVPPPPRGITRPVAVVAAPERDDEATPAAQIAAPRVISLSEDLLERTPAARAPATERPTAPERTIADEAPSVSVSLPLPVVAAPRSVPRQAPPLLPQVPAAPRPAPKAPEPGPGLDDWLGDDEAEEDLLPSVSDVPAPAPPRVAAKPAAPASAARAWLSGVLGNVTGRAEVSREAAVVEDDGDEPSVEVERTHSLRVLSAAPDEPQLDDVGRIARRHGLSGRFLKEVRQLREMSLEDLVRTTRISSRFLLAIEEDDFERLPNATFVRGYLKQVAEALGVADRGVVDGFMEQYKAHRG
jgi:hypothetical protein